MLDKTSILNFVPQVNQEQPVNKVVPNIDMSETAVQNQQPKLGTKLSDVEEVKYQSWKSKLPKNLQWEGDYDLRGLWKENPNAVPSPNLHFTDKYKLPNHPSFSDESIYFNPSTKKYAGKWIESEKSWDYIPYDPSVKKPIKELKEIKAVKLKVNKNQK